MVSDDVTRRGAGALRRLLSAAGRLVLGLGRLTSATVRWMDRALRGLDDEVRAGTMAFLRAARLDREAFTVRRALARSPAWLREAVQTVGGWLETAGRRLGRAFAFLPGDRTWRQAALGTAMLLVAVSFGAPRVPPEAKPLLPGAWRPIVVGYFENGWGGMYGDSNPTFQRNAHRINIVMPFWHSIHPDGSIEDRGVRPDVIDFAHRSGIPVVPLFNNAKVGQTAGFVADPAAREEAVAEVMSLVRKWGYDGVHIDFELLPPEWRDQLTSFIAELRAALGPNRHLSIAVFPKVDVDYSLHGAYDYAALSGFCDFLVLMAYDRHYAGGPAGPVSPFDWVESNITYALTGLGVPPGKFVVAVGAYGYDWVNGGGTGTVATDVPSRYAADMARRHGAKVQWDDASQNPYFIYYAGRVYHEVWYQDERVMAQRIALARKYKLRGIAIWRLGYETPETWPVIRGELGAK